MKFVSVFMNHRIADQIAEKSGLEIYRCLNRNIPKFEASMTYLSVMLEVYMHVKARCRKEVKHGHA